MEDSSKRDGWNFGYPVKKVLAAASAKLYMHRLRLAFWTKKQKEVMAKARRKGLSIHESIAEQVGTYSNSLNARIPKAQIVVDVRLQQDLQECNGKLSEHRAKVREFEGWVDFLSTNTVEHIDGKKRDRHVYLTHSDHLFFFGR